MNPENKIDTILNQLENKSLPDLTKQDEHWHQMKMMLQSEKFRDHRKTNFLKKYFWWMAIFIVITGIFFYTYTSTSKNIREITSAKKEATLQKIIKHQIDTTPSEITTLKSKTVDTKNQLKADFKSQLYEVKSSPVVIIKNETHLPTSSIKIIKDTAIVLATETKILKDTVYSLVITSKPFRDTTYSIVVESRPFKDTAYSFVLRPETFKTTSYSSVIYSTTLKDSAYAPVIDKTFRYPSDTATSNVEIRYQPVILKAPSVVFKDSVNRKKNQ